MKTFSNVTYISNVYFIDKDFRDDLHFKSKVIGRDNLKAMLKVLSGQGWIQGAVSVDEHIHLLTDMQQQEWEQGKYCTYLNDREEIVWGVVKKDGRVTVECRCYKTDCQLFQVCRPGYHGIVDYVEIIDQPSAIEEVTPILTVPILNMNTEDNVPVRNEETPSVLVNIEEELPWEEYVDTDRTVKAGFSDQDLSDKQENVIESKPDERLLILAGPGTGKTYCLIEKLKHMVVETCSIAAENILLLCFTRAAVKEIRDRLKAESQEDGFADDLSRIEIRTFDSFATRVLIAKDCDFQGLDYDARIVRAISVIKEDPEILNELMHFMVDEIQDLVGVRAKFVKTILENAPETAGFTLLGDHLQGIYDYQVKDLHGEMNAVDLLDWVRKTFGDDLQEYSLHNNLRQKGKLSVLTSHLRSMLLSAAEQQYQRFFQTVSNLPIRGEDHNFTEPAIAEGRTAILCRTNGEVLKLSSDLRKRNINHNVIRRFNSPLLPEWISELYHNYPGGISMEKFCKFMSHSIRHHSYTAEKLFYLLQSVTEESGRQLHPTKLIQYLSLGNRLPDEMYEHTFSDVTVSTIHQAKGREYDTVLYYYNNRSQLMDEDILSEAKISYVAITRAREQLQLLVQGKQSRGWLQRSPAAAERWTRRYKKINGRVTLGAIEVGRENDLDETGFVSGNSGAERQDYIKEHIDVGDEIKLKLESDIYCIYHNDTCIGHMSQAFMRELDRGLKEVYGWQMTYKPVYLDEVYVNRKYTVIKRPETLQHNICSPFNSGVWLGVSIVGLGRLRWPTDI